MKGSNSLDIRSKNKCNSTDQAKDGRRGGVPPSGSVLAHQEGLSATGLVSREGSGIWNRIAPHLLQEVGTDAVREATQSHASESPVPGEHTDV
jgi:hypothetical protein